MNINTLLTVASIIIFLVVIALLWLRARNTAQKVEVEEFTDMDKVIEAVKNEMVEIVKEDYTLGLSDAEFDRLYKRKARINEALKNCVYGIDSAKVLVQDLIRSFIAEQVPPEQVTKLLGLDLESEPSDQVKFEIMMYRYKKAYGKDALTKWIDRYDFSRERVATGASKMQDKAYYITVDDLNYAWVSENIQLDIEEQIDVMAVIVYQQYKGFGVIDTVREMNVNGLNMGTSGSILSATGQGNDKCKEFKANTSVWLYDRGKYIHLRFINFGTEEELRRIIQLIVRWGNPGPLTSKRGYMVNTMYDKSRVLAVRPPVSEYWACFIRKFTLSDVSPEALIIKEYTHKGELAIKLIELLMRGCITCAVTGRQGSGKTTLMSSIIRYIDPRYTIRVLEMAPELYLRELYPTRNILSLQETNTVSAAECQDALKKSDAAVSIVGEVATDSIAARMVQMGMTASLFTIFSHHANTPKDLVLTLRNSLVNDGGFSNMETAEKQVTDVVKIDIHLDYTPDGKRYIDRISEIVQLEEGIPYPDYDLNDPENSMNKITAEYYRRKTDRVGFTTRLIMHYDLPTHTYICDQRLSKFLEDKLRGNLDEELQVEFDKFMLENWGPRTDDADVIISKESISKQLDEYNSKLEEYARADKEAKEKEKADAEALKKMEEEQARLKREALYSTVDAENTIRDAWKTGYLPDEDVEKAPEFSLGTFFDDDDYN